MNTNTNADLLARINHDLAAGRTVYVGTTLRVTTFSPKTVANIRARGVEPFKLGADGSLRMVEGWTKGAPRFVCIAGASGMLLVRIVSK